VRAVSYRLTTTPLVDVRSEAEDQLEVIYAGVRVGRVDLVRWTVANIGTSTITRDEFETPLSLNMQDGSRALSAEIATVTPAGLEPIVAVTDDCVTIAPLLLNPGDTFTIATLVADNEDQPVVGGRIAGVRSLVDGDLAAAKQVKQLRRTAALTTVAAVIAVVTAVTLTSRQTGKRPRLAAVGPYAVMNTAIPPPDGIYFRRSPRWADTARLNGLGVYGGENVLLNCSGRGDAVGPLRNTLWYYVTNVTRPTFIGHSNAGWLNSYYIDDKMRANVAHPGVPDCQAVKAPNLAPPKPLPSIVASRGDAYSGGYRMNVKVRNFPVGKLPYQCYDDENRDKPYYSGYVTIERADQDLRDRVLCFDSPPFSGHITIGGYRSNRVAF
jgi:hypothetical protein